MQTAIDENSGDNLTNEQATLTKFEEPIAKISHIRLLS
jgi:hypothetical protein